MTQDIENEIWADIGGYEGYFQVSNMGRVKSLAKEWKCGHRSNQVRSYKEKVKPISYHGDGYGRVILIAEGKKKIWLVHRLVAISFIPNPENKKEVNHKNGNKKDNRASELEWATPSENGKHAFVIGLKKRRTLGDSPSSKLVLDLQTGVFYSSAKEAAFAKCINYQKFSNQLTGIKKNKTSMIYV